MISFSIIYDGELGIHLIMKIRRVYCKIKTS